MFRKAVTPDYRARKRGYFHQCLTNVIRGLRLFCCAKKRSGKAVPMSTFQTSEAFLPVPQDAFSAITAAIKAVRFKKGNFAVYLGILPPGCRPIRPNELPRGIDFAGLLLPATSPAFSQRICLAFNQTQLENDLIDHRWAFVVKRSKTRLLPCPAEDLAAAELLKAFHQALTPNGREAVGGAK